MMRSLHVVKSMITFLKISNDLIEDLYYSISHLSILQNKTLQYSYENLLYGSSI